MHAVRNQPQGFIEMPEEQNSSNNTMISDQDQTLEMTVRRLAAGSVEGSLLGLAHSFERLLSEPEPSDAKQLEIVFADSVQLQLDLAVEMNTLLERMQTANKQGESRYL